MPRHANGVDRSSCNSSRPIPAATSCATRSVNFSTVRNGNCPARRRLTGTRNVSANGRPHDGHLQRLLKGVAVAITSDRSALVRRPKQPYKRKLSEREMIERYPSLAGKIQSLRARIRAKQRAAREAEEKHKLLDRKAHARGKAEAYESVLATLENLNLWQ